MDQREHCDRVEQHRVHIRDNQTEEEDGRARHLGDLAHSLRHGRDHGAQVRAARRARATRSTCARAARRRHLRARSTARRALDQVLASGASHVDDARENAQVHPVRHGRQGRSLRPRGRLRVHVLRRLDQDQLFPGRHHQDRTTKS